MRVGVEPALFSFSCICGLCVDRHEFELEGISLLRGRIGCAFSFNDNGTRTEKSLHTNELYVKTGSRATSDLRDRCEGAGHSDRTEEQVFIVFTHFWGVKFNNKTPDALSYAGTGFPYQGLYNDGKTTVPQLLGYGGALGLPLALWQDTYDKGIFTNKLVRTGGDNISKQWGAHTARRYLRSDGLKQRPTILHSDQRQRRPLLLSGNIPARGSGDEPASGSTYP